MNKWKDWNFVSLLTAAERKRMPWKNGGGSSSEIAIEPAGSSLEKADFEWRLSTAEIMKPGPFSAFPGCERLLALLKGTILTLVSREQSLTLRAGEVCAFSGSEELTAELPEGPVTDLGLIYRPECARAKMSYLEFQDKPRSFQLTSETVFFLPVKGGFAASVFPGEMEFILQEGDALRVGPLPAERLVLLVPGADGGLVIAVEMGE